MSTEELLSVEPQELEFPFELKKQSNCSLQLTNKTNDHVVFKVKTTHPKKYCVRPNAGVVLPYSSCDVIVTMQAQKEAPLDMQCKDKFLLQSAVASRGITPEDITADMFTKESGNQVEEWKLRVNYVAPNQPPSPVREGSDEGSSPRDSISDSVTLNTTDFNDVPTAYAESNEKSSETQNTTISQLNDENEKQNGTISPLQDEHEKQNTTNVDLMDENEKHKVTISLLNDENESQKATISRLNGEILQLKDEIDKQKTAIAQLNDEAKSTFRASVKEMVEMINEFRKSSEDNIRMLSRRIRVAEQLHNETQDLYKKNIDNDTIHSRTRTDQDTSPHEDQARPFRPKTIIRRPGRFDQ